MRRFSFRHAILTAALVAAALSPAAAMSGSQARYLGSPDLTLTAAMIAAGGGPAHFDARKLVAMMAAQHAPAEAATLAQRFGAARVQRFFTVFDAYVDGAVAALGRERTPLPVPSPALTHDPELLATSVRAAGIMPDGRFDVGYLIEHLLSRPLHKQLMDSVDANPAIGPAANADFHIILTAAIDDFATLYPTAK